MQINPPANCNNIVAIVGRPNVGKSTLFNRIIGSRLAIVEDEPGTTRDRNFREATWNGVSFTLVDTGGFEKSPESNLRQKIKEQVEIAIKQADVIILVLDGKEGILPSDLDAVDVIRRSGKPVVLAINKIDSPRHSTDTFQFYELALGEPINISAYHGIGIDTLLDSVVNKLPERIVEDKVEKEEIKVAIIGRPNVGKSMLLNSIINEERCVVDESPGTTRDAVDTSFQYGDYSFVLIDTAGIRRRGRIDRGVETYSLIRARSALERADISLLLIDAVEGLTAQDEHIGGLAQKSGKGCIIIINKWDLIDNIDKNEYISAIRGRLKFLDYAPLLSISALTKYGVNLILPEVVNVYNERKKHINTGELNSFIKKVIMRTPPPTRKGRQLKIFYMTQTEYPPPTFVLFVNDERLAHFSYRRHIQNQLKMAYGFYGNPINLVLRPRKQR